MTAEDTTRQSQVLRILTLTPEESRRFHALPLERQHEQLAEAGFDVKAGYSMRGDSAGMVYITQPRD